MRDYHRTTAVHQHLIDRWAERPRRVVVQQRVPSERVAAIVDRVADRELCLRIALACCGCPMAATELAHVVQSSVAFGGLSSGHRPRAVLAALGTLRAERLVEVVRIGDEVRYRVRMDRPR